MCSRGLHTPISHNKIEATSQTKLGVWDVGLQGGEWGGLHISTTKTLYLKM